MAASRKLKLDWTTPKPASQIFEEISTASYGMFPMAKWIKFQKNQLKKAQVAYPQLDLSVDAKIKYTLTKHSDEVRAERQKPRITVREFFKIAYNWDPFSPTNDRALVQLLTCDRFEDLPLGKLDGHYQYNLMPGMGALPTAGVPQNVTDFGFANAGGGAIAYADGHPSEADQIITFRSKEDDKLRHIMPLGWLVRVISKEEQIWERTGHALVMDMDEGRQRHPWIVLAKSWPDDREGWENDEVYAEEEVQAGDRNVHGILPDTRQRTPVGCFVYGPHENSDIPLLLSFGPDFTFGIKRLGGRKAGTSSANDMGKGPGLAKIMNWYDDAEKGQLVCYDSNGREYMRYHKGLKQYRYISRFEETLSPNAPASRFITLEERFTNVSIEDPSHSQGQASSSGHPTEAGASGHSRRPEVRSSTEI